MRIKNQFLISILIFIAITIIIAVSVFAAFQQTSQLNGQEAIARDVQTRANNLVYISSNYFLYQDSSDLTLWQKEFSALSTGLENLRISSIEQQTLFNNVKGDADRLNGSWAIVVSYLGTTPRNVTVRIIPAFQADWSIMSSQNQALVFDAQQLSQSFRSQIDQSNLTSLILILALLGLFGAYFVTNYLITYRKTLKSISELQAGIAVVGTGNLDYSIKAGKKDEVEDISRSFNQMTTNLKAVTASKSELERSQTLLRESEERWATTLASIGDAVIATDLSGKIDFMNGVAEELTGWKLTEASGKPLSQVFNIVNEQSRLRAEDPVAKVLEKGLVVGLANHTILIRKDGTDIPIDDSGAPIADKEGKITGVVLVFRDITERKKAEENMLMQADLIDLSPDAIIVRKLDGTITFWSKGAEKLYGWTEQEAIGQVTDQLFKTEFFKKYEDITAELSSNNRWTGQIKHMKKNGETVIVQSYWLVRPNDKGEIKEIFESNVDITHLVYLQEKLEDQAVQLEEFANQMEQLAQERLSKLKDAERLAAIGATAGMVGHDIRNPLQAITSDAYLAKAELEALPDSEQKKMALESIEEIGKNTEYINKIVQDLQDYARPLNPKMEESDLKLVVEGLIAKNGLPENIDVEVDIKENARKIKVDAYYLNRILANLVSNAVQAMPKGGKLTVQARKDKQQTILLVKDTGVGIPENVKEKMFTVMFTTKSKGQGFGLPVVKRMTESLGGTVTFESQEGKGTTFTVRLPSS